MSSKKYCSNQQVSSPEEEVDIRKQLKETSPPISLNNLELPIVLALVLTIFEISLIHLDSNGNVYVQNFCILEQFLYL